MTSFANIVNGKDFREETERREGERKEGEGRVLINRTSLSPTDTFIRPPKASKLNAFCLRSVQVHSLKTPLEKLAFNFAQRIPRQKREHQETVLLTLKVLFKNFQLCWEANKWVSIQGGNSAFSNGTQYERMGLGRNIMRECLALLTNEGYLQKADYDFQARQTALYYPANLLQTLFMDCLYIPYKGHKKCGIFVSNGKIERPANLPSTHKDLVSIYFLHDHFKAQRLPNYSPLRFIFKESAVDAYCLNGGRLYTNTQQIPIRSSPIRKFTTINFEKCCEVDLSANHLRMCAALLGKELRDDPYLEIQSAANAEHREDVKRVIASLLSSSESKTNRAKYKFANLKDERDKPIPTKTFDAIHNATNQIYPWFKSTRGIGNNLQSIEGQILLEAMLLLIEEGITSIPIHDSLRVPIQHNEKTAEILKETWSRHLCVGFETKVSFKNY